MSPAFARGLVMGLITGSIGVLLLLTPFGRRAEEDLGLGLLFSLRGPREVPPQVSIVGVDRPSIKKLGLPENMELWPRSLYADLVDRLVASGASLIVFDIFFGEPRDPDGDHLFASSVKRAGNVVLVAELVKERMVIHKAEGSEAVAEKVMPPYTPLADCAAAFAPFVLPKVPVKVSQVWLFRSETSLSPTLPAVAFMMRNVDAYDELVSFLRDAGLPSGAGLPETAEYLRGGDGPARAMSEVRRMITSDSDLREKIPPAAGRTESPGGGTADSRRVRDLLGLFTSPDSRHLNFYGPPGTVPTLSLAEALGHGEGGASPQGLSGMKGGAVFVGLSDLHTPGQKDGFYTVFSTDSGFDLSGVEIAATAYANLLEDRWVRPFSPSREIILAFCIGMIFGMVCRLAPLYISIVFSLTAGGAYLYFCFSVFASSATWYPLIVPLCVQVPCAAAGSVVWRLHETGKERHRLRESLAHYLPEDMVRELLSGRRAVLKGSRVFQSACLFSDAGRYTTLAESTAPAALADLMNRYFEVVFHPIRRHGGTVSNVVADSVLALWISRQPDTAMHERACLAALEIETAVARFNNENPATPLPTRIGLHAGEIFLGSIGALDHYEYRPFGDIVNTATRIDGISRALGVTVCLTEEVRRDATGIETRELGVFRVPGKRNTIRVHEAFGRAGDITARQKDVSAHFSRGLSLFRQRDWSAAEEEFRGALTFRRDDGPSLFYLDLCARFRAEPPAERWQGEITIEEK